MFRYLIPFIAGLFLIAGPLCSKSDAAEELFDTKAAADLLEKGISHLKTRNIDAAVNALEESVSIAPEAEAYYYLGYAYYMKGRTTGDNESRKKSIESFEKAYELDPDFTPSRYKPSDLVPQQTVSLQFQCLFIPYNPGHTSKLASKV
jgi:tetratricopeptide (TPR) repeat protein